MNIYVRIPTVLRKLTGGAEQVTGSGATVAAVLKDLELRHAGITERICNEDGKVRHFVNIFLNGENIRHRNHLETLLQEGDELAIVLAMAGGCNADKF